MRLASFMESHGRAITLAAGTHLFRQGDPEPPCFLLQEGLLKAYYLTAEGKDFIKSFFMEGAVIGSLRSGFEAIPCPYSVVALEPCSLIALPLAELRRATTNDLELANELIDFLVTLAIKKERREHDFLILSPAENYRQLQRDMPRLVERITQNDTAKYLGITPVALSRIRRRRARSTSPGHGRK